MKKSKFYILFSILIVVLLFSVSALCNQCGFQIPGTDTSKGSGSETVAGETTSKESGSETKESETTAKETNDTSETTTETTSSSDTSGTKEAPTIKLEIYDGPSYSAGDDICYYRIKAIVTGKPAPSVSFSKDDSGGVWGSKKAQINIHRGEHYTLTATATNSVASTTDSIALSWGCGAENRNPVINEIVLSSTTIKISQQYDVTANATDPDGDSLTYKWTTSGGAINNDAANPMKWTAPAAAGSYTITVKVTDGKGGEATQSKDVSVEAAVVNLDVPKVDSEGGYIEDGGKINSGGGLFAGDSAASGGYIGDRAVRGFISFDITGLNGKTIDNATLTFNLNQVYGDVAGFGSLWVGVVDWGAEPLVLSDFGLPQVGIQLFDMAGGGNITCDAAALKTQLQSAINAGKSRFQIRIRHTGAASDIDNTWDGWSYLQAGVNLNINYH